MDIILGIIGSVVGGFLFTLIGGHGVTGCNLWSLVVATIGALVVIALARAFSGGRRYR
jgi:uncharacterized membrane protein YeaQ/YmgE (transglycosylase-associated protein family)